MILEEITMPADSGDEHQSERSQATHEEELARVKRQNELILEAAGEGIYGLDCEGKTTFLNPAAAHMLGWEVDALLGQPMHTLLHHTKPDGSSFPRKECPIYAAFKDGAVHHVEDEVFWRKDGSSFPVEYTSTPIVENGKLAGAVVVFKDITERKQAEQELHQAYANVECMKERLEAENVYLQEEFKVERNFAGIIGQGHAIQQLLHQIELVAPTDASVLISGESGTGKELIASAIHEQSKRHERPMIRVNCAAIPRDLFESEFFGHIKGAFTGALKDRTGRFELADGGTIFLDEVGEIPLELQSKLLRVLQEGQIERVGEEQTRSVDVRVVAATNRDLKTDIDARRFREDLFFRLNVFPIEAIPLRDRIDDIPILATHFITLVCRHLNRPQPNLTQGNLKQLQAYHWPGNIRELQNVIERAIIVSKGSRLQFSLPGAAVSTDTRSSDPAGAVTQTMPFTETERLARDRANILAALRLTNGKISGENGAAELLGIKPTTLASRMKSLDVEKPK
jgi:PAS domain S-box-containing protein